MNTLFEHVQRSQVTIVLRLFLQGAQLTGM